MFIIKRWHCTRVVVPISIFFCFVCYGNVLWQSRDFQEEPPEDIGAECIIPELDPFSKESAKYKKRKQFTDIKCIGEDWVKCYQSKCRVVDHRLQLMSDINCTYNDIIYENDRKYVFGPPSCVKDDEEYTLVKSDHVMVTCTGMFHEGLEWNWTYYGTGFREPVARRPLPPSSKNALNVLILMFDSTSRTGFIRNLPKTYEYLVKDLGGTVLKGYNIVGDGTPGALFPILTGNFDNELPNVRIASNNNRTLDSLPFIFYDLKKQGYRTAYFEDMPWIGTFQYKFNGFRHQPTDHYLRPFFMEEGLVNGRIFLEGNERFCVGDTPQYKMMLSLTDQFFQLNGKKFCHTFISDLTHDDLNMLSVADSSLLDLLHTLTKRDHFQDTILLVMGDHGPRFGKIRDTLQGKLEERLPFACVVLPEHLKQRRPEAQAALEVNANRWTTPFDVHTTILDALDMPQHMNPYMVPGVNIARGLSFLKPIPRNRSCWDAGIDPHWCTCLGWRDVLTDNPLYQMAARKVMRYINLLTDPVRHMCAFRTISAIDWVKRQRANKRMLALSDGYVQFFKDNVQVRIVSSPGNAIYEASMSYVYKTKRFSLDARHISRINAYGNESSCVSEDRSNLSMFCYCTGKKQPSQFLMSKVTQMGVEMYWNK